MKYLIFLLVACGLGLMSCNSGSPVTYEFGSGLTATWDKTEGALIFSGKDSYAVTQDYRRKTDTIEVTEGSILRLDTPGRYSFQLLNNNDSDKKVQINRQIHYGIDAELKYNTGDAPYNRKGLLNDGISGNADYTLGEWVGWKNEDAIIEYNFEEVLGINYITLRYRDDLENNIFPPKDLKLEVSVDGQNWQHLVTRPVMSDGVPIAGENLVIRGDYKGVRITLSNYTNNKDTKSWLLVDEVMVYAQ